MNPGEHVLQRRDGFMSSQALQFGIVQAGGVGMLWRVWVMRRIGIRIVKGVCLVFGIFFGV
jgi:hypothetical protein